jgi:hypothetical protein
MLLPPHKVPDGLLFEITPKESSPLLHELLWRHGDSCQLLLLLRKPEKVSRDMFRRVGVVFTWGKSQEERQ